MSTTAEGQLVAAIHSSNRWREAFVAVLRRELYRTLSNVERVLSVANLGTSGLLVRLSQDGQPYPDSIVVTLGAAFVGQTPCAMIKVGSLEWVTVPHHGVGDCVLRQLTTLTDTRNDSEKKACPVLQG